MLANPAAEVACLGACLLSNDAATLVSTMLRPHDFTVDRYATIHTAVCRLLSRREPIDVLTLTTEVLHKIPDPATTITSLETAVPTAANVRHYIALVRHATVRRQVRAACQRTLAAMDDPSASVPESLAHLTEDLEGYLDGTNANGVKAIQPVPLSRAIVSWQKSFEAGPVERVRTGYPRLDRQLSGGFRAGQLIYLGARPGVGKSTLALHIATTAAETGIGVLVVSREMVNDGLVETMVSQHSQVPALTVTSGMIPDAMYPLLAHASMKLANLPVWLCDDATSLEEITSIVDRWSFTPRLGLVVVDYLQLIRAPHGIKERRHQIETVSQGLKSIAMKYRVPVLCLSSLRRPETGNPEWKPSMADLRESGELEHDADVILFLHRKFGASETEVILAKNKKGPVGSMEFSFKSDTVTFTEVDHG